MSAKKKNKTRKSFPVKIVLLFAGAVIIGTVLLFSGIFNDNNRKGSAVKNITSRETPLRHDADIRIIDVDSSVLATFKVEIAETVQARMKGLMYRSIMPFDQGMFFIFEKDEPRSFWMENTYIPLDVIFINQKMEIVRIRKDTRPRTRDAIRSDHPAKYVLEVNSGMTDRYGISEGQRVILERVEKNGN